MNTQASNNIRPVLYSGLSESLVTEHLISSAGIAEVNEPARTQGLTLVQELLTGNHVDGIASSLTLIIAQRLARRLCKYCAEPETSVPEAALKELGFTDDILKTATINKPVGCKQCRKGYSGRVGVYEVVKVNKDIAGTILNGANVFELEKVVRAAGFYDLRTAALKKCAAGIISLEEVNRVTVD